MQYINVSELPHTAPPFLNVYLCSFLCAGGPTLRIQNLETELNK